MFQVLLRAAISQSHRTTAEQRSSRLPTGRQPRTLPLRRNPQNQVPPPSEGFSEPAPESN